jgi:hypothetical protein
LSEKTNDENDAAKDNSKPRHGYPFYSSGRRVGKGFN